MALVAKAPPRLPNQRRDFCHKEAHKLVQAYDAIYCADMRDRKMAQNHALAKSISDAGWSAFLINLAFKAANAGKQFVMVNPTFTSQRCSDCGVIVQKGLSIRWRSCPGCRTSLHRDHNVALSVLRLGREIVGWDITVRR
jgi:putative transposase